MVACALWLPALAQTGAQGLGALARLIPEDSRLSATPEGVELSLALSQPVPFRVYTLDDPARLVVDFREVDFGTWPGGLALPEGITAIDAGPARGLGWSRLVLTLASPLAPRTAGMLSDPLTGRARVDLGLVPVSAADFRAAAGAPPEAGAPQTVLPERIRPMDDGRIVVVIDPGHGGVDPGAVRGDHTEADLVLAFSRELRDALRRTGRVEVVLTRDADVFVPLPTRVAAARAAQGDLIISVHADALAEGRARGATVYTLSDTASDEAAEALAEQHDRADLLQGIDLHGSDDVVAGVLMDLARLDTAPRSDALADVLVQGIGAAGLRLHSRPRGEAGFTVLRAADIPSVLLEIGFMSDEQDLRNILDPDWRASLQAALVGAILDWADADAARMALVRQ
jgi:N-acetylmuramoyl-L-alanine amidase